MRLPKTVPAIVCLNVADVVWDVGVLRETSVDLFERLCCLSWIVAVDLGAVTLDEGVGIRRIFIGDEIPVPGVEGVGLLPQVPA